MMVTKDRLTSDRRLDTAWLVEDSLFKNMGDKGFKFPLISIKEFNQLIHEESTIFDVIVYLVSHIIQHFKEDLKNLVTLSFHILLRHISSWRSTYLVKTRSTRLTSFTVCGSSTIEESISPPHLHWPDFICKKIENGSDHLRMQVIETRI